MQLSDYEAALLAGQEGPAVQRAMQIVTTLGRVYGAPDLIPVASVQVAGVSYRNLGDAGLEFNQDWAAQGARVQVPTTLNPSGMDHKQWREQGFSEDFAAKQVAVVAAYTAMGIMPTCTCIPYEIGNRPRAGQSLAWSESSAVVYANSVLAAHTNREGGPSALAAAICGRTARYGLHLPQNRLATHRITVRCPVRTSHEFAALGYLVGKQVGDGVPCFVGLELPPITLGVDGSASLASDHNDALKLMGAALASSGAVALYHVEGVTLEAQNESMVGPAPHEITVDSLAPTIAELNHAIDQIDLVVIGCPHASLAEIGAVAEELRGKKCRAQVWVTTARAVRDQAAERGWVAEIEAAGGLVVADGCVVVAPMRELCYRTLATNSPKMAAYALPHAGLQARFGDLSACMRAAVTGCWEA